MYKPCVICRKPVLGRFLDIPICFCAYKDGGIIDSMTTPDLLIGDEKVISVISPEQTIYLKNDYICSE